MLLEKVHPFLAVNDRIESRILVIEGWSPDYAFEAAKTEFQQHPYDKIYVTGGPMERGVMLSEYRTYAELGEAVLRKIGMNVVQAVPSSKARKDRTYLSAVALLELFQKEGQSVKAINLLTLGAHARRSRLLFEKALGKEIKVGIVAIQNQDYDSSQWWKSSMGFRVVSDELIAYVYATLFFSPTYG